MNSKDLNPKNGFDLKGNNSDRAVLMLHGLTGSPFEMRQYAKSLFKSGYDVFCPCLPGHFGDIEEFKKTKWQDWHNFTLERFDYLKQSYQEVYVAGLCLGAVLALTLASERKNVSGIICLSTTLYLDGWTIPWYRFLLPVGFYTLLKYFYVLPDNDPHGIKNESVRKKIESLLQNNSTAFNCFPMVGIFELIKLSKYARKHTKHIDTPTLIIHSRIDDFTSLKSAEFVYKNVNSLVKKLVLVENSYHLITLDNDKESVSDETVKFLNDISSFNKDYSSNLESMK